MEETVLIGIIAGIVIPLASLSVAFLFRIDRRLGRVESNQRMIVAVISFCHPDVENMIKVSGGNPHSIIIYSDGFIKHLGLAEKLLGEK